MYWLVCLHMSIAPVMKGHGFKSHSDIHVQYTQTKLIRLRHFTIRLDSNGVAVCANRLPACRFDNRGNDLCQFDRIESNRQHFQPTLHSPPEVKICEIMIHILSSFLKRGHKLQSIRSNQVESTTFLTHPTLSRGAIF